MINNIGKFCIVLLIGILVMPISVCGEEMKGTLEGFSFELPNENGTKLANILGANATVLPGGIVEIDKVRTIVFSDEGREVIITSPTAVFDKGAMQITTDSPVKIDTEGMLINGIGLFWKPNNKLIEIKENVKVELDVDLKEGKLP